MSNSKQLGGIKGFLSRAYQSVETLGTKGGIYALSTGLWAAQKAGNLGFYIATTAMVTFVPLMFEIARERQSLDMEKSVVKDFRNQGFGDRQLAEMGFTQAAIHEPSVAKSG